MWRQPDDSTARFMFVGGYGFVQRLELSEGVVVGSSLTTAQAPWWVNLTDQELAVSLLKEQVSDLTSQVHNLREAHLAMLNTTQSTGPMTCANPAVTDALQYLIRDTLTDPDHPIVASDSILPTPDGAGTGNWYGISMANIGDVDGDGVADLAVGALYDGDGGAYAGAVYIVFMAADGSAKGPVTKISAGSGAPWECYFIVQAET